MVFPKTRGQAGTVHIAPQTGINGHITAIYVSHRTLLFFAFRSILTVSINGSNKSTDGDVILLRCDIV